MIFGVISDIHSNLEALKAVLGALEKRGVEGYICCGDIVGYGPSPNEVVERVRGLSGLSVVSGNHDLAVVGKMEVQWFNELAQAAIVWTQNKLSAENRAFLEALPPRIDAATFTLVHGSPRNPPEEYVITRQQFIDNAGHFKVSPCFVGHSHISCSFSGDPSNPATIQSRLLLEGQPLTIRRNAASILNAGSVGQPRDRDTRASCGLFDDAKGEFEVIRVPYAIEAVQRKMRDARLPEFLAERLALGQ